MAAFRAQPKALLQAGSESSPISLSESEVSKRLIGLKNWVLGFRE